jgi:hypothetical protein
MAQIKIIGIAIVGVAANFEGEEAACDESGGQAGSSGGI